MSKLILRIARWRAYYILTILIRYIVQCCDDTTAARYNDYNKHINVCLCSDGVAMGRTHDYKDEQSLHEYYVSRSHV